MVHIKKNPNIFIITLILIILALLTYFGPYLFVTVFMINENNAQKRLLCETNYNLLLETCRKLPKPIQNQGRSYYSAKSISSNLPQGFSGEVILNLKPERVYLDENGCVSIAFGHTFWHFGIRAYPKDFNGPLPSGVYGDRELIPGLWYYDELYQSNQNYSDVIDRLVKKNKYLVQR